MRYKKLFETQDDIQIGDMVLFGKFKNKKAIVKSFGVDKNNQPTLITDKGVIPLYHVRISKIM